MSGQSSIVLRVKRSLTDSPAECLTACVSKRRKLDKDLGVPSRFRYVGTGEQSSLLNDNNFSVDKLTSVLAVGEKRIRLPRKEFADVLNAQTKETKITSRKRRIASRDSDDENDEASSSGSSPPAKSFKIIDVSSRVFTAINESQQLNLALTNLSVNNVDRAESDKSEEDKPDVPTLPGSTDDPECVYDYYVVEEDDKRLVEESVVFSDEDERDVWHAYDDADSDSNSESNWRNDYPDEEELSSDSSYDEYGWGRPQYHRSCRLDDDESHTENDVDSDSDRDYDDW